jgi:hypothetical protein
MRATPITDETLKTIQPILAELNSIIEFEDYFFVDFEIMLSVLEEFDSIIHTISLDDIKKEFWENCEDYEKIPALKKVFDVKFKILLNWRFKDLDDCFDNWKSLKEEIDTFISFYETETYTTIPANLKPKIKTVYRSLNRQMAELKENVTEILNEFAEMTPDHLLTKEMNLTAGAKYRIAKNKKTDFIKLISAMYDSRMFETKDGYIASNKQDIMFEFGSILGEDFSKYSTYLSMAKKAERDVFMKTFKEIEKKGAEYYDKEIEKQ